MHRHVMAARAQIDGHRPPQPRPPRRDQRAHQPAGPAPVMTSQVA